jgi:GntR family transcriptional regulator
MPTEVVRPEALYRQVANVLREAIDTGEYPPGSLLPSEAALTERYKVSRPTVRLALAMLRTEGLIKARNGKGSYVREGRGEVARTIQRTAADPTDGFAWTGDPEQSRCTIDPRLADLLGIEAVEPAFAEARTGVDAHGRTVLTRRILPFAATENTSLETAPFPPRADLLAILEAAHGPLITDEYVRADIPQHDEIAQLALPDATSILETTRITRTQDGTGLLAEIHRASAQAVQYGYRLT